MRMDILTLFPDMFTGMIQSSIIKRAIEKEKVEIHIHDFRTFSKNKHKKVDDTPYGGGAGMLLTLQPLVDCLKSIPNYEKAHKILTSASGSIYNQKKAHTLSCSNHIIVICGHYEGIDERIRYYIDEEISLGDFILTGGEIASMALIDSIIRLIPEVIAQASTEEESFAQHILEYPQYTKPAVFEQHAVPNVLISGNHEEIRRYRRYQALKKTYHLRKELLNDAPLTKEDCQFLEQIKKEEQ